MVPVEAIVAEGVANAIPRDITIKRKQNLKKRHKASKAVSQDELN
jgi:hypothetical protein